MTKLIATLTLWVAFIVAVPALADAKPPTKPNAEWAARMDGLALALTSLLEHASSDGVFDEARRMRIKEDASALRSLAHGLSKMESRPDADPTISWLLTELEKSIANVDRAKQDRVQDAVFEVAWTCVGCHTRAGVGTKGVTTKLAPVDANLPADVRGIALAATRRFDDARKVFRGAVFDEALAEKEPRRWERAVMGSILLDLRLSHDVKGALEVVDQVLHTPGAEELWQDASEWRKTLLPMLKTNLVRSTGPESLTREAQRLMDEASSRSQDDAGREILYLKATSVIHELLMGNPPKEMRAQALSWLGESYRELRELNIWSIHLIYDAACVEEAPHSILAAECYARWLDSARAEFTGNGGGDLPSELMARNRTLRALASPR